MSRITAWFGACLMLTCCALPMLARQPAESAASGSDVVVPPLVNFSSVLTDLNGKPLTSITGVTFFLYKEEQGGAPLWLETQNVQPDKTGHYSVMLGSTTSSGLPTNLFGSGEARWLGVQPQGQAEQPRVMLLSVPYALKAGDAATVGGLPPSAFVLAAPSGAKAASSSSLSASSSPVKPAIAGSGTQNYIPLWTDSKGDLGNSVLSQSGANINLAAGGGLTINGTQDGTGAALVPNQLFFQDNGEIASHDAAHRIIFDRANNILEFREWGNIEFSPGSAGTRTDTVTFPTGGGITLNAGGMTVNGTQDGSGSALIPNQVFFQDNGEIASHDAAHRIIFDRANNILELREYGDIVLSAGSTGGQRTSTVKISNGNLAVNGGASFSQPVTFASNQTFPSMAELGANTFTGAQTINTVSGTALTAIGGTTGVYGVANSSSGYGVEGDNSSMGTGVYGYSSSFGNGVAGYSISGFGVSGNSNSTYGVVGSSNSSSAYGVYGYNSNGGVCGVSDASPVSCPQTGMGGAGVSGYASGTGGTGVFASSTLGYGVYAVAPTALYAAGTNYGAYTFATNGTGVVGGSSSAYGIGVCGYSGTSTSPCPSGSGYGVYGSGTTGVYGISPTSGDGSGVSGYATNTYGVLGTSTGSNSAGVYGEDNAAYTTAAGVYGYSDYGSGVYGYGPGSGGYGGYFWGNVHITGSIYKGSGTFEIDHPLDPANKYLYHSFVESPDMMNIYNGNAILGSDGTVWITLPDYFEALNRDFRYQLTAIGAPGPNLYIAQEIANNRFQIAGGTPGGKVSWQVTGIRQDAFAKAHPIIPEVEKTGDERGKYLYPVENGQPKSMGIDESRRAARKKMSNEQLEQQPR